MLAELAAMVSTVKSVLEIGEKYFSREKPTEEQREQARASFEQARRAMELAEAQVAQGLGIEICDCAFPPGYMLRVGDYQWRCNKCGRSTRAMSPDELGAALKRNQEFFGGH